MKIGAWLRAAAVASLTLVPAAARGGQSQEVQMGRQLFDQLRSQGEIVSATPLYDRLGPIAQRITKVVQPRYPYPIRFYIVHERQPNAFAAPGGNVYVVDSLFYFVKNTEELAGTICHETSHLLHHDSINKMKEDDAIRARAIAATIFLGPSVKTVLAATAIGRLHAQHYSRQIEEAADLAGADTCAAARYNPWGLVWLFQDFAKGDLQNPPEVLSDHPNDAHRIAALERHFLSNPATFASFDSNPSSATPLNVPASEAERFLR